MAHALGFVDLAERLDPGYDWAEAYSRTGMKPTCLVGFTIGDYGSKYFVTHGDNPIAMLRYLRCTWTVIGYNADRGEWRSEVLHSSVASALDHLLDVMDMFLSARDIEDARSKVRAHTKILMANRQ